MAIIRAGQEGSLRQLFPESVIIEREPEPFVQSVSTNVVGVVMQTTRGNTDEIYTVGSMQDFSRKLGGYLDGLDGFLWAKNFFDANGGVLAIARVASSGTVEASVTVTGQATSGNVLTFTANSVGTWGNDVKVSITNNSATGFVNVLVVYGKEQYSYEKVTTDISDTDNYIVTKFMKNPDSIVDVTAILQDGTLPATGTVTLSGGSNGSTTGTALDDSVYVGVDDVSGRSGIQLFKESDEVIMVVSARSNDTINNALIAHVNDITLSPRRTVITFEEGTSVSTAITTANGYDDDKVAIHYPLVKVRNIYTRQIENVSPVPFATAFYSISTYDLSLSNVSLPASVIGLERKLTPLELGQLTDNRINPIYNKKGRGEIFGSDYTTSSNPAKNQVATRRAKDTIAITVDSFIQIFISKPITPDLWASIKNALDNYFRLESQAKRIGRSDGSQAWSVKVDSTNNPQSIVQQNKVIIEIEVSLLGHADKIYIYLDASVDKTIVNA